MFLWREISKLVGGHTHFCRIQNTLWLWGAWGVAMISVQLLRHGLVQRGNGLVVTVNPGLFWQQGVQI